MFDQCGKVNARRVGRGGNRATGQWCKFGFVSTLHTSERANSVRRWVDNIALSLRNSWRRLEDVAGN